MGVESVGVEPNAPQNPPVVQQTLISKAIEQGGRAETTEFLKTVETAFRQDPSLIAPRLKVSNTQARAEREGDFWQPDASTSASTSDGGISGSITITQPLYDFGQRHANVDALNSQANLDRVSLDQARESLAQSMLAAIISAQESQARIGLNQRRIATFRESLNRAERLLQLNLITASDTRLAQVRLNEGRKDLETARITLEQARVNWRRYTGGETALPKSQVVEDLMARFGVTSPDPALKMAEVNNLDIREAQKQLLLLQSQLRAKQYSHRPTINAVTTTQLDPPEGSKRTRIRLSLDYTLFSRPKRDELLAAQDNIQVQNARISQFQSDLRFDIQTLWQSIRDYRRLAALDRASITALRERADDLESKLDTGLIPFDQVVNARAEQFDAELSALSNQYAAQRAIAQLLILSGVFTGVE